MLTPITPESLPEALQTVSEGKGMIWLRTAWKATKIDSRCLKRWANVPGKPLLRVEGEGFRMRQGKGSVYILPGYLTLEVPY